MNNNLESAKLSIFALMTVVLFATSCKNNKTVTGKDFMDELSGNVESVEEDTKKALYDLKVWREDPSDTLYYPKLKLYDKDGNLLKEQEYSSQKFYDAVVYEYKDGKLIRFLEFDLDKKLNHANKILKSKSNFEITEMLIESVNESLNNDTIYFTWKDNRVVKVLSSKEKKYVVLDYNEKGHLSKSTSYNSSDSITEKAVFEYLEFDKAGNWTKRVRYNPDNPTNYPFIFVRKLKYF